MAAGYSSRASSRRSAMEWAVRGGLALLAVVLAGISGARSLADVVRKGDPALAHTLAPEDARAAGLLARQLSGLTASTSDRLRADRLARAALRRDPTVVVAVATLGLNAQIIGDTATARRLFAYSDRLSRRDLMTRLWLIEDAVGKGDVAGALHHYDIALRTGSKGHEILYPVLASASNDPDVARQLVNTLAGRPFWAEGFIGFLAANTTDPTKTARLFRALVSAHVTVPDGASATVIKALAEGNSPEGAWSYYSAIRPNAARDRSRDPQFISNPADPSLFDWQPVSTTDGITATIERGESGGVFDFAAAASVGGVVLRQEQFLPAGNYMLDGHSTGIEQPAGQRPYWVLVCKDGRELGRVELPNSAEREGKFSGRLSLAGDCLVQSLRLVVRPSSITSGVSGQIDRVILHPFG